MNGFVSQFRPEVVSLSSVAIVFEVGLIRRNSLGLSLCTVGIADCLDDDGELWLKRGTTDEEAIDIWLGNQVSAVASVCGTAVLDPGGSGDVSVDVLAEP